MMKTQKRVLNVFMNGYARKLQRGLNYQPLNVKFSISKV